MEQELTINSSQSLGKLRLSASKRSGMGHRAEYLNVYLEDRELAASSSRIYVYEPNDLLNFFAELASQWEGWAGEKEWNSVEGDFALSCTSDGLGHVAMRVKLKSGIDQDDWCVQTVIHLDASQLQALAMKVKAFLNTERAR